MIEFESSAIIAGHVGLRMSLIAYPYLCVKKVLLSHHWFHINIYVPSDCVLLHDAAVVRPHWGRCSPKAAAWLLCTYVFASMAASHGSIAMLQTARPFACIFDPVHLCRLSYSM